MGVTCAIEQCLCNLWMAHWGRPLKLQQITWQDSQFEFFEPGKDLSQVFTVRLEERILVREEYRVAYAYFDATANYKAGVGRSSRFILTGHPGVGKTCFMAYALLRRLSESKVTGVQLGSEGYVVFDEQCPLIYDGNRIIHCKGSRPCKESRFEQQQLMKLNEEGVWALSDVAKSEDEYVPCKSFLKSAALVIQAVSPASDRWADWKREQRAKLYVMSLWTEPELGALLSALELDVPRGLEFARLYGPCARDVVLTSDPDEARNHFERLEEAIGAFGTSPKSYLNELYKLKSRGADEDSASSLFFVQPTASDKRGTAELCIPTASLLTLLGQRNIKGGLDMPQVLSALAQRPSTVVGAQWILECYMHVWLSTPGRPAIRIESPTGRIPAMPLITLSRGGGHIPPCDRTIVGDFEEPDTFDALYWCPTQGHLPGIDAAIYVKSQERVWVFQATVDESLRQTDAGLEALCQILGQNGYIVQYKELVITKYSSKYADRTMMEAVKDHPGQGFNNVFVAWLLVTSGNRLVVKLMEECATSAPNFAFSWQQDHAGDSDDV